MHYFNPISSIIHLSRSVIPLGLLLLLIPEPASPPRPAASNRRRCQLQPQPALAPPPRRLRFQQPSQGRIEVDMGQSRLDGDALVLGASGLGLVASSPRLCVGVWVRVVVGGPWNGWRITSFVALVSFLFCFSPCCCFYMSSVNPICRSFTNSALHLPLLCAW